MGNVGSTPEEGAALCLRDPNRLTIASLTITNSRKHTIKITPDAFPATRISATRDDSAPVEFVQCQFQDSESSVPNTRPEFMLKLINDDELFFTFTFVLRQAQQAQAAGTASGEGAAAVDTQINGLTYVYASTPRDVENLVTREFHADPNLHKNANVELVGDYSTEGSPSVSFEWSWKWKPPKSIEDGGGGWRNACSFVEYDQRAHRLYTLASFSFFVANASPFMSQPSSPPPALLSVPPRPRVASAQSVESRMSAAEQEEPTSPVAVSHEASNGLSPAPAAMSVSKEHIKVDLSCPRPEDNNSIADDGPVFRATMKALEQKTGNMRTQMKRLIKTAAAARDAQVLANEAWTTLMEVLKEVSSTNANAVQPAIEHYFDKIAREILDYERINASNLNKIVIEPLTKVYQLDIKQAEAKKREFEEESKDFYSYVSRYLGQRQDSVKAKQSDTKYQTKRKNFELKRFDYSSFMQDLSGGRKEQEVLSHLTRYADAQARAFLATSKRVDDLLPPLEALFAEIQKADKEKEGLLWALNRPGGHVDPRNFNKQGWHKFWIVLDQGKLSEYSNWKQKLDLHMEPIDLRLASVREARNAERRFCFEVITPQYKRVYQATSEDDMVNWITSINNALQSAMEGHSFPDKQAPSALDSGSKRDERTTSRGNSFDDPDKLLQMLRDKDPENATCADCGSSQDVKWCSINLGIIICIECSGAHRKLTTDVSKVRSLTLDVGSFTPHIIELFMLVGNRISNQVWEARLDPAKKLAPASPEERLEFITNKYVKRLYVQPISTTLSSFQTADETLIAAVKRNDIQQVLYALALRASLNATDKSRGTPALFLALAAADPASPSPAPSPAPSAAAGTPEKVVPFAVAEMLIQNGAKIPDAMPAFPLSRAAQAYLDAKRGRAAANAHAVLVDSYDGNGLAPNHGSATTMGSMAGVGALSPSDRLQREKESRLQKRISAGGRLAKMPIPER
ncbi:hypothetical protein P8C59_007074 [Phyllachora maydis]|uniref:ADP-ribosylation factor GTPase-activating protein n=1 Tax=Phyllachora maydis TaxID=1825666 RepID=A0AAD9MDU9_9PEZI|nr:hypothetical protein P8C59_007074 [Phyllachora maydis]